MGLEEMIGAGLVRGNGHEGRGNRTRKRWRRRRRRRLMRIRGAKTRLINRCALADGGHDVAALNADALGHLAGPNRALVRQAAVEGRIKKFPARADETVINDEKLDRKNSFNGKNIKLK